MVKKKKQLINIIKVFVNFLKQSNNYIVSINRLVRLKTDSVGLTINSAYRLKTLPPGSTQGF